MKSLPSFITGLLLAVLAVGAVACGSSEESDKPGRGEENTEAPKVQEGAGLVDQSKELKVYNSKVNRVCKEMFKDIDKANEEGSIELTDYLSEGSRDLLDITDENVDKINAKGKRLNKKLAQIENTAYKEIEALDGPVDQKDNFDIWIDNYRSAKKQIYSEPTFAIDRQNGDALAAGSFESTDKLRLVSEYGPLMGAADCNPDGRSFSKSLAQVEGDSSKYAKQFKDREKVPAAVDLALLQMSTVQKLYADKGAEEGLDASQGQLLVGEKVKSVQSPNTVVLESGKKIRLGGVAKGKPDSCYSQAATQELKKALVGKKINVQYPLKASGDINKSYGYIYSGGASAENINLKLLLNGSVVPPKSDRSESDPLFEADQIAARVAKTRLKGVWKSCQGEALELSKL